MPSGPPEMEKTNVTGKILSLTLEVIHLMTGEEYIVVQKSSPRPCVSSRWRRMDSPPPSVTPEMRNVKKILHVANKIIHLLSGEVLGCLEEREDLSEDVVICEEQASTTQDTLKSRNKMEGLRIQIAPPHVQEESEYINQFHRGSNFLEQHEGSKSPQQSSQQKDFSPDSDTGSFQGHPSSPDLCDVGTSNDDQEDIEYAVVQIKEELERWKDGEGFVEDDLAEAETSTTKDIPQCQADENGSTEVSHANKNTQDLSDPVVQCNSTSSPTIPNAKTYKCLVCTEVFSCRSDLLKHQSHHRGLPLFTCAQCGKNFTSKSNLVKHQKIHTGEKPYSCAECGKSFREKHYLASHQAVHQGAQLILCPQCGKGYTSKSNLAKHQRIHTGQKPFGCSICGKSFNQRSVLLAHQRTHTGEKPFSCDLCERRFTDRLQLVRHLTKHSEEKQFCCNECNKSFSRKDLLLKHLATHSVDASPD